MLDLQTLVLNADYRPLSYNPLSLWSWKDAFTALFLDRVTLVASYDVEARSPSRSLRVPERGRPEELRDAGAQPGLHPLQHLPARHLLLPVLRPAAARRAA